MALLREISGPNPGRQVVLDRPRMVLGRHPDCDVIIEVGAVSRQHAQILLVEGEYHVEDLNSRNGTFVNDRMIQCRQRLSSNDRLRVCDVSFIFLSSPSDTRWAQRNDTSASAILVDDESEAKSSTIMSRLDVSSPDSSAGRDASSSEIKLAALLEIIQSLGKALSLDEVLPQVLESLFKIFTQADRGFIVLRREDGILVPQWTQVRRDDEDTIRISRTIVNQVMELREAILSADAASDERFEMSQSIADFRIRSVMCAPLINSDGDVLGVLQIDTLNQRHRFQPSDLEVLASVASQAAIAIDSARLHERAMQQQDLQRQLELAQQVQQRFLPQSRPEVAGYEFYDFYQPANQIGGDFYDYVQLPDGRIAVIVADVVGHGVPAALLMAKLTSESRFCLATEQDPAKVVSRLNTKLCEDNIDDRFVTLVLAVLHPTSHNLTVVNAGHMAPLLCRGNDRVEEIGSAEAGLPLGVVEEMEYRQVRFNLTSGQIVVLFTDGLTEAMDENGDLYGLARVRRHVSSGVSSPKDLVLSLVKDVQDFVKKCPANDDMCLVSFGRA